MTEETEPSEAEDEEDDKAVKVVPPQWNSVADGEIPFPIAHEKKAAESRTRS